MSSTYLCSTHVTILLKGLQPFTVHSSYLTQTPTATYSSKKHSRDTTCRIATLLHTLASTGLSWKLLVTDAVGAILFEVLQEGAPLMGAGVVKTVIEYMNRDWMIASAAQNAIALKAEEPLRKLFKAIEDKRPNREAHEQFLVVGAVNQGLKQFNLQISDVKANAVLPMNELKYCVQNFRNPENEVVRCRQVIAKRLSTFGFKELAQAAVGEGVVVEDIVSDAEDQGTLERLIPRLTDYTDLNNAEESSDESSSSGPSAGSTSETNYGLGIHYTDSDSNSSAPDHASAVIDKQPIQRSADSQTEGKSSVASADFQTGAKAGQSTRTGLRASAVPGPVFQNGITVLGKVTEVQAVGEGYRAIVNVGTDNIPVYRILPGASFGRGTCNELYETHAAKQTDGIKQRKGSDVRLIKAIVEVETNLERRTREPITKFLVAWKSLGEDTWVLRSDMIGMCGREYEERTRVGLLKDWHHNLEYLKEMKHKGLHPETGKPLREDEKDITPWLFDHFNAKTSSEKLSKKSGRQQQHAAAEPPVESIRFGQTKTTPDEEL